MHSRIGVLIAETLLEDVDDLGDVVFQHGHLADKLDYIGLEVGWQYLNCLVTEFVDMQHRFPTQHVTVDHLEVELADEDDSLQVLLEG